MPNSWTILVYLAGDNDLEFSGEVELAEMKKIGSNGHVQIVAQFDRMSDQATRRYHLTHDRPLSEDVVATIPETNTGDPATLLEFVRWGLAEYPAEHVALVLWNHGNGWKDDDIYALARNAGLTEAEVPPGAIRGRKARGPGRSLFLKSSQGLLQDPATIRGILFDDSSHDFLDSHELKSVLDAILKDRGGRKLDVIGFDACLMNMVEVAAQLEHACEYMVGSQEDEPDSGWPYAAILAKLTADPTMAPETFARTIVDEYMDYTGKHHISKPLTQSALRLGELPPLIASIDHLAERLIERLYEPTLYSQVLLPALGQVPKFRDKHYVDLASLANMLAVDASGDGIRDSAVEIARKLQASTSDSVVVASRAMRVEAGGLSIYVPLVGTVSPLYFHLEFTRRCKWGRFLKAFEEL